MANYKDSKLFTPMKIGNITLKNRIVMPPMCMYSADEQGFVQPFHLIHYGTRAQGGVALIIIEATAVQPQGRISDNDLGIWSDEHIIGLKSIVDIVHGFGAHIAIQLAHAGRKTETGKGISSWDITYSKKYPVPEKMNISMIEEVFHDFEEGARRAQAAGFDMVEIHGAHGYLINQFLSPLTNMRSDEYGCQKKYNITFLKEIIKSVKTNFSGPISLRISSDEYVPDGLHPKDFIEIINEIQENIKLKLDLLNVSSGGIISAKPNFPIVPGYQMQFTKIIKKGINIPILAGGLISSFKEVNLILSENTADLVWLGREILRNPYWVLKHANNSKQLIDTPKQYKRAEPY